ncbi:SDR family oxidoreductase [Sphingobacterium shayense]|uniref:SDR family oxidoreductase n=1 Tax=Sphingobacterium shayense TaxID=626343 RepID=UPI001557B16E|nr:SDR family oxidoreductase [Sphingobacterium shayense]NQD70781.1 SDR family oxidoreductase [Sphingobacterium shayense]
MEKVENKKVFLTGGTAGIGRATTLLLAERGYEVFIIGRSSSKLDSLMSEAKGRGLENNIKSLLHDLADYHSWTDLLPKIWKEEGPFSVLINNAAVGFSGVQGVDPEDLIYMTKTNLDAYLRLAGFFAERMKAEKIEGDIINIGSMSADGREGTSTGYVASKAGIQGFTEALRKEVNPDNIRVSLIEPAAVGTDMQSMPPEKMREKEDKREMLKSEDIADLVYFILSRDRRISFPEIKVKALRQFI